MGPPRPAALISRNERPEAITEAGPLQRYERNPSISHSTRFPSAAPGRRISLRLISLARCVHTGPPRPKNTSIAMRLTPWRKPGESLFLNRIAPLLKAFFRTTTLESRPKAPSKPKIKPSTASNPAPCKLTALTFNDRKVRVYGSTAVVTSSAELTGAQEPTRKPPEDTATPVSTSEIQRDSGRSSVSKLAAFRNRTKRNRSREKRFPLTGHLLVAGFQNRNFFPV